MVEEFQKRYELDKKRSKRTAILTNGSLRPVPTAADIPIRSLRLSEEQLQQKSPSLDLSQYLIPQKMDQDFSKYIIHRTNHPIDASDNEDVIQSSKDLFYVEANGPQQERKLTRVQKLRRSLTELKKRVVRPMTMFTACFSSNATQ